MSNNNKDVDDVSIFPDTDEKENDRFNGDHSENTINIQQLFSSLFFGLLTQFDDRYNVSGCSNTLTSTNERTVSLKESSANDGSVVEIADHVDDDLKAEASYSEQDIEGVLDQIDKLIPHDPIKLRQSSLYKSTLQLLHWQRDNYLVGNEYADWRKNDRLRQQQQRKYYTFRATSVESYNIPYNQAAIGHHQISLVASDFIPTATVQNLLSPIVTGLFAKETGVLFDPIKQCTINLIIDQQKLLEQTMKNQLLQLLDNPRNRDAIKDSTQGIIIQTAKFDDIGRGETK